MFDTLPIAFAVFLSILYHIQPVTAGYGSIGQSFSSQIVSMSDGANLEGQ